MILRDMCCIKHVRIFEVWVPWNAEHLGIPVMDDAPFTLLGDDEVIWERKRH